MADSPTCLLDTNIVSEMMKRVPDPVVSRFLDRESRQEVFGLAVITVFEILNGIGRLPEGQRRDTIAAGFDGVLSHLFHNRIVAWDEAAARASAAIVEKWRRMGEPLDDHFQDAMLAGIAHHRNLKVVTRNDREFRNTGITVLNPWAV